MLTWLGNSRFEVDGTRFHLLAISGLEARPGHYTIAKTPAMVERYVDFVDRADPRNVVELGIHKGGSVVLLTKVSRARRIVAVDLDEAPAEDLEQYIEANHLHDVVRPHYGVDQADAARLTTIVAQEFDGNPLDLVIDDASHMLEPTRKSFNALFPRLRPGGWYLVEDWTWAHLPGPTFFPGEIPLSVLGLELMLACASEPGLIDEMVVDPTFIAVKRGADVRGGFDISRCYGDRARALLSDSVTRP